MCGIAGFISPSGRVTEAVKGLIDVVSITAGLDRTILRHRALPASATDIAKWEQYWEQCNRQISQSP